MGIDETNNGGVDYEEFAEFMGQQVLPKWAEGVVKSTSTVETAAAPASPVKAASSKAQEEEDDEDEGVPLRIAAIGAMGGLAGSAVSLAMGQAPIVIHSPWLQALLQ